MANRVIVPARARCGSMLIESSQANPHDASIYISKISQAQSAKVASDVMNVINFGRADLDPVEVLPAHNENNRFFWWSSVSVRLFAATTNVAFVIWCP